MYSFLQTVHSYFAYAALLIAIAAWVLHLVAKNAKSPYTNKHRQWAILGMIAAHVQLLLGLILYFISPMGVANLSGATMKDSLGRLYALEHPLMMILGIGLITIGYVKSKKATDDNKKFHAVILYFGLGLIFLLSRIPWAQWLG